MKMAGHPSKENPANDTSRQNVTPVQSTDRDLQSYVWPMVARVLVFAAAATSAALLTLSLGSGVFDGRTLLGLIIGAAFYIGLYTVPDMPHHHREGTSS